MKDLARFCGKEAEKQAALSPVPALQVQLVSISDDDAGQRIDNFLLRICKGVPKSHLYRILRSGEVRVNKGRIDQLYRLVTGDVVRIPPVRIAEKPDNTDP